MRSSGIGRQNTSSLRRGMYQSKLMPQLAAGSCGSFSCDSGIAISTDQPSGRILALAGPHRVPRESRAPCVSSVWTQSARTPAAVNANEYASRRVFDGSSDTMNRSAPVVSSNWVSAASISSRPPDHIRAPT